MEGIKSGRSVGIDIIKSMAAIFVLCVHFSLNTKYYQTPIINTNMFIQSCLRWLFFAGVPLFIICTGYLNYKNKISRSYYLKIFRVLIPYVLISILCLILKKPVSFQNAVYSIFNFTADSYSWYVNMYIGLFLLAPLFNVVINTLDKKKLFILLCTLLFVIAVPATLNPFFVNIPKISFIYFPDWWKGLYPILYYFIGAYISKYQITIKKSISFAIVVILICLQTVLQIMLNQYKFNNWFMSDYSSLFVVAESIGLFLLFYSSNVKRKAFQSIVKCVSMLTLEIYLCSYITDSYLYPYFSSHFYGPTNPMSQEMIFKNYFLMIVPLTFISSLALSIAIYALYKLCKKVLRL